MLFRSLSRGRRFYITEVHAIGPDGVARLLAAGESLEWGVAVREGGRVIGTCGLHSFDEHLCQAEMGCMLARRHWGQGLMGEALTAVMEYAGELGIHTLLADIEPGNLPSQRLLRRLGFVWQQGTLYRLERQEGIRRCPW